MDDKQHEYLQKHQPDTHADVEAVASHVKHLLSSFGVPTQEAVKVYGDLLATGDTHLAAYTAAISVAEEVLRQAKKAVDDVEKVTKALEQNKSLAILRDHIRDFCIDIAYKTGFCSWGALADKLHFERKISSRPTHVLLETTLKNKHLSMKVWNEVKEVADAGMGEFHQGNDLDARLVMQLLHDDLLPEDLVHTKSSLIHMLQYTDGACE